MNGSTLAASPQNSSTTGYETVINEGVRVVVRVRPLSTKERANAGVHNCVRCLSDCIIIDGGAHTRASIHAGAAIPASQPTRATTRPYQFSVDQVFHTHASQIEVYEQSCKRIVEGVFHGINGSILAYGATGSGKTHTMFGSTMSAAGIVYQAVQDIFAEKERLEEEEGKRVCIKCSFLEIYNEEVFDLLAKPIGEGPGGGKNPANGSVGSPRRETKRVPLQVRECFGTTRGSTSPRFDATESASLHISGLTHIFPETLEDFARGIEHGHAQRFVASTGANSQSSRSHAIITVEVEVRHDYTRANGNNRCSSLSTADDADVSEATAVRSPTKKASRRKKQAASTVTIAKIQFADLAGSERAASTSNTGLRLREGGNINRSLLALGGVVQSLVQQKVRQQQTGGRGGGKIFIPYRGSKLTRLLRDSIGGNCRTQMIFCLSPSTKHTEETVNTMRFAMNAKEIQVEAHRNEFSVNSSLLAKTQEVLIEELREELARAHAALAACRGGVGGGDSQILSSSEGSRSQDVDTLLATGNGSADSEVTAQASLSRKGSSSQVSHNHFSHPTHRSRDRARSAPTPFALPVPLKTTKGAKRGTITPSAVVAGGAAPLPPENVLSLSSSTPAGGPDVPQDGGGLPRPSVIRAARPSVFAENVPLFSELEERLKNFSAQKESLYHEVRDAQERERDGEMQLRRELWRLATFLVSDASGNRARGEVGGNCTTAVGVAGLRKIIASKEAEQAVQATQLIALTERLDDADRQFAATRQDLLRERQGTSLELLLDNARLRQGCTEAECLAAHYHQECRSLLNRQAEYAEALSKCVEAIQRLRPYLIQLISQTPPEQSRGGSSGGGGSNAILAAVEAANVALLFALLPTASTAQMGTVFESALQSTVSLSPPKTTLLPVSLPAPSLQPAASFVHPPLAPSPTNRSGGSRSRSPLRGGGSAGSSVSSHLAQNFRDLMATAESMHLTSTNDREASENSEAMRTRRGYVSLPTEDGTHNLERRSFDQQARKVNESADRVSTASTGSSPEPFRRTSSLAGSMQGTALASAGGPKKRTGFAADKTSSNGVASKPLLRGTNGTVGLHKKKSTGGVAQSMQLYQRSVSAPLSLTRTVSCTTTAAGVSVRKPRAFADLVPVSTSLARRRTGTQQTASYSSPKKTSVVKSVVAPPPSTGFSSTTVRSNAASAPRALAFDMCVTGDKVKRLHQHGSVNMQPPASSQEASETTANSSTPKRLGRNGATRTRLKGSKRRNKPTISMASSYPNVENVQPRAQLQQGGKRRCRSSGGGGLVTHALTRAPSPSSNFHATTGERRFTSPQRTTAGGSQLHFARTTEITPQRGVDGTGISAVTPSTTTSLSRISSSSSDGSGLSMNYGSGPVHYNQTLEEHPTCAEAPAHRSNDAFNGAPASCDGTPQLTVARLKECAAASSPELPQYNAGGSPLIYSDDRVNKETNPQLLPQLRSRASLTDDLMVSRSTCLSDAL
ncbi:hypothetical protein JKF63_07031 [Porcisia hertigi]|uniref:Kinesin motor domain-containing protein n=1 Tax=Porcisia hertigi TaxID=2761500 RepID=A0A836IQC3_9TRYP|nr:hypothetical protein JKF63_07031 [Porcisia hertigi]